MVKKITSAALAAIMAFSFAIPAFADSYEEEETEPIGYIVLGADLTNEQKKIVYENFGIEDTEGYAVSYCTNEEEHAAFDEYLDYSIIGDKAYSSIMLIPQEEGEGISITTSNINYCTISMYQSALISAGVEDVDVTISAPIPVSGTCALLGAINAYEVMTGEEIDDDIVDAAVEEMVTMGEIGDEVEDNDTAAELMSVLKQEIAESKDDMSEEEIAEAIEEACSEFEISLSDETIDSLVSALSKLQENDALDADSLKEQASDLFDNISGVFDSLGINGEGNGGFFQNIVNAVSGFFERIGEFFSNIGNNDKKSDEEEEAEASDEDEDIIEEEPLEEIEDENIEDEGLDKDNDEEIEETSEESGIEIYSYENDVELEDIEENEEDDSRFPLIIEDSDDIAISIDDYQGNGVFVITFNNKTDKSLEMKIESIVVNGNESDATWEAELEAETEKQGEYVLDLETLGIDEIESFECNIQVYEYDEDSEVYIYYFNGNVTVGLKTVNDSVSAEAASDDAASIDEESEDFLWA